MKSGLIAYICYVSSCRQEFTRITLRLLCDRHILGDRKGRNRSREGPKEVK